MGRTAEETCSKEYSAALRISGVSPNPHPPQETGPQFFSLGIHYYNSRHHYGAPIPLLHQRHLDTHRQVWSTS